MATPYDLLYARAFDDDLDDIPAYDTVIIRSAVVLLVNQPETATRHRRRLSAPITWCPEAAWQLRVGSYRVLYRVDGSTVRVLRVTFKGRTTTEEMGR